MLSFEFLHFKANYLQNKAFFLKRRTVFNHNRVQTDPVTMPFFIYSFIIFLFISLVFWVALKNILHTRRSPATSFCLTSPHPAGEEARMSQHTNSLSSRCQLKRVVPFYKLTGCPMPCTSNNALQCRRTAKSLTSPGRVFS